MERNSFTQKEMLIRVMDKLEKMDDRMREMDDNIYGKIEEVHYLASKTNGKVKLHSKIIFGICGAILTIFIWIMDKMFGA